MDESTPHGTRYFEGKPVHYNKQRLYTGGHGYSVKVVYWNPARPWQEERCMDPQPFFAITTGARAVPQPAACTGFAYNIIVA